MVMRDFDDVNVLSLIGVALKGQQPLVVLPYMMHGDLKTYIKDPSKVSSLSSCHTRTSHFRRIFVGNFVVLFL